MSNIGFPLTEFVLEGVLRDGLGELRANLDRLDDLFARFKEAQFNNQYGQNQIEKLKTYISGNQIKIVHSFNFQPTAMPCFSIQIVSSSEDENVQNLGNVYGVVTTDKDRDVLVDSITPVSYDPITGKLVLDPSTDLSIVCPNLIFTDSIGVEFTIQSGISNQSGDKYINIGPGKYPDLTSSVSISSNIDFRAYNREMIRLREVVRLGVHAKDDIHLAKYLYYILYYIVKSRQTSLIRRGVHLDRGNVSVFDRLDEFEGENIFSRTLEMHCLTEFNWNQGEVAVADCFDLNLYVNDPNPDSPDKKKI